MIWREACILQHNGETACLRYMLHEAAEGQDEEGDQLASDAAAGLASTSGGEPAEQKFEEQDYTSQWTNG